MRLRDTEKFSINLFDLIIMLKYNLLILGRYNWKYNYFIICPYISI